MYPIPANATRIRYLESTGTQYIDTGVGVASGTIVEGRALFPAIGGVNSICGCRVGGTEQAFCFWGNGDSAGFRPSGFRFDYGTSSDSSAQNYVGGVYTSDHFFDFTMFGYNGGRKCIADSITIQSSFSTNVDSGLHIYAFAINTNGTATTLGSVKISELRVYYGSTLVRSFVPVRVGTTGYLFDRVSGQLFGNAGTGDFVLGPDTFSQGVIPTRMMPMGVWRQSAPPLPYDAEVGYIEFTGTQYINTLAPVNNKTVITLSIALRKKTDQQRVVTYIKGGAQNDVVIYTSGNRYKYSWGGFTWQDTGIAISTSMVAITIDAINNKLSVGNTTINLNGSQPSASNGNLILGIRDAIAAAIRPYMRCYSVRITESGVLVRDFQPVRVGTVGYLYDRANPTGGPSGNGLYGSATSTPLVAGPDKIPS